MERLKTELAKWEAGAYGPVAGVGGAVGGEVQAENDRLRLELTASRSAAERIASEATTARAEQRAAQRGMDEQLLVSAGVVVAKVASNGELQSRLVHCTPDLQYVEWLKVGSGGGIMSAILPAAKRVMALSTCTLRLLVGAHNSRQKAALVLVPDDAHASGAREKELVLLLDSDNAGMQIHWAEALANRWLVLRGPAGRMPASNTPWRSQLPLKEGYLRAIENWFDRAAIHFFSATEGAVMAAA